MNLHKNKPIVLFDGVCNLCNASVNMLIDLDKKSQLYFASLQSEAGQALLKEFHLPTSGFSSMAFVDKGRCYTHSTAVLKIGLYLGKGLPFLASLGLMVPGIIRDSVYKIIARNRYKWFGKQNSCRIPTPELKKRFLE